MRKQLSRLCGGKRSVLHLPAISEEAVNDTLLQKREGREEIIQLIQSRDKCGHSDTQNRSDKEGKQTEERKTLLFPPIHGETSTDDRKRLFESTTNLLFQAEKQKDLSEAKVLFPDFFQQGTLHGSWEAESPWKARPTMEQIFSGRNNLDFPVKSELRYDTNFEYWKRYQLSF